MTLHAGGVPILSAIREMRPGDWDASDGEVVDGVLVMRPIRRRRRCCGEELVLVAEAVRGDLTWELRRCRCCERTYSIGPKLPPTWVSALARACIELYCEFVAKVETAYGSRGPG
jgi:hypothetical protein